MEKCYFLQTVGYTYNILIVSNVMLSNYIYIFHKILWVYTFDFSYQIDVPDNSFWKTHFCVRHNIGPSSGMIECCVREVEWLSGYWPVLYAVEGLLVGDVVHEYEAHGASVVGRRDGAVALLSGRVLQHNTRSWRELLSSLF